MVLLSVTSSDPNYPNHPIVDILYRLSYLRSGWKYSLNLVDRLVVASASPWMIIPEMGVVRSLEPFKFLWAPTISLERLKLQ